MAWIADHILWLLSAGWVLSLVVVGRALLAIWRWIRPKPGPSSRSRFKLAGAALMLAAGALGLVFTSSGLVAIGPGILAQQRMLGDTAPDFVYTRVSDESMETLAGYLAERPMSTEHGQADPLPWPDTGRPTTFLLDREGIVRDVVLGDRSYEQFEALVTPLL